MAQQIFESLAVRDQLHRNSRILWCNAGGRVGATAGWTLNNNNASYTLPASQTASTLVINITGLHAGDIITAFRIVGQIESAGNTVTLDADFRKTTAAAADLTDASIGAITQISKTADYLVSDAKTFATAETLASGEHCYVLLTGTTAATTDIAIQGIEITYNSR